MIKIEKNDKYHNVCNCCHSKKNISLLTFQTDEMPNSNVIPICANCLNELKKQITKTRINTAYELEEEIDRLMDIYDGILINRTNELVLEERRNIYVPLSLIKSKKDLQYNMLCWKSRPCITGDDKIILDDFRKKFNLFFSKYINKPFSFEEVVLIYTKLGNEVNPELAERFIDSGYDLKVLKE